MKKVFLFLLFVVAMTTTKAQVTNFAVSNTLATFEYINYSGGQYHFKVFSRTKCPVSGIIKLDNMSTTFVVNTIPAHDSSEISITAPAGANILTFLGDYGECDCNCGTNILQICLSILPVKWGQISAKIEKGSLEVNWTTETESLNDHFNIMTSVDGINFEKVATVQTKATNGISSIPVKYSMDIPLTGKMAMGFMALGFLGLITIKPKNKKLLILPVSLFLISLSLFFISCQKENVSLKQDNKAQFLKIVQISKDGNMNNSQVVRIVK